MKQCIIGLLLALSVHAYSQNKIISDFYDLYQEKENVTDVKLQGWLLELASEFTDEEEKNRIMKDLTYLRVMIMSEGNLVEKEELKGFIRKVKKDNFAELMQIKSEGTLVDVYVREEGDVITDVLALINDPGEAFILLSVEGKLKFSDLNNLHINVEGMEHLKEIPEERKDIPRA